MRVYLPEHPPKSSIQNVVSIEHARRKPSAPLLSHCHETFRRWLSDEYDATLVDIILSVAAANILQGRPVWLMIIAGPGTGKTESITCLESCNNTHMICTIDSTGSLLSATKTSERSDEATGGILRMVGNKGMLLIKDFTTILSTNTNIRPQVLAALREVHDGRWVRNVGVDGGKTIEWQGHLGIVAACTTAWDTAHSVIATMGDRFIAVRLDCNSYEKRMAVGRQAMLNGGKEHVMKSELRAAGKAVIDAVSSSQLLPDISVEMQEYLLKACNIASMARTPVESDLRGKTIYVHDSEAPTRLAKGLTQMMKGGMAIGIDLPDALDLALRCVRDSIPPVRLECLIDLSKHADCSVAEIAGRINRPWNAVDRAIQALHSVQIVTASSVGKSDDKVRWVYNICDWADMSCLWPAYNSGS